MEKLKKNAFAIFLHINGARTKISKLKNEYFSFLHVWLQNLFSDIIIRPNTQRTLKWLIKSI